MSDDRIFAKCAWRLMPLLLAAYIANYIDRSNVGFAALTINRELGFSPSVYGFGAGIFFVSYGLFQLPANIALYRVGARRWFCAIMAAWGIASAANALIQGPATFYTLRFLLGAAEAGLVPGVILYLTYWFPAAWLGRMAAIFVTASPVAPIIGGPIASMILRLDGLLGIDGWRWLFFLEGLPPLVIAAAVIFVIPDGPESAAWLSENERSQIGKRMQQENAAKERDLLRALHDPRVMLLALGYCFQLFAGYGLVFWVPLIVQQMGFSNSATGVVTALVFLGALPAMVLWARHSDENGERIWHAALPALLMSTSFAIAAVASNNSFVLLALAAGAIGSACFLGPNFAIPALFLTGPAMAGGIALVNGAGNLLGGFGGQYFVGLLRERTGDYSLAFAAFSATSLVTALVVLVIGRSIAARRIHVAVAAQ